MSNFQGFKVSKILNNDFMLLIDMDHICQIFKHLLDGSTGFASPRLSHNLKVYHFRDFEPLQT